jgi:hypothetical protein
VLKLKYLIAGVGLMVLTAGTAFAGNNTNANALSSSGAISGSYSSSTGGSSMSYGKNTSVNNLSLTYNDPPAADPPSDPSTTTSRVVTTATVIPPATYTNNPCGLAAGFSVGWMGAGFGGSFDRVDHDCNLRAWAQVVGHAWETANYVANTAKDNQERYQATVVAAQYRQWLNNYMCMQSPEIAAAAPAGSGFCSQQAPGGRAAVGTVPAPTPVVSYQAPAPLPAPQPVQVAHADLRPADGNPYGYHSYGPGVPDPGYRN